MMWRRDPTSGLMIPQPLLLMADRGRQAAAGAALDFSALGSASDVNTNDPDFGTMSFGAADADRYILFALAGGDNDESDISFSIGSVTIGGVSATISAQLCGNTGAQDSAFGAVGIAAVPTGATGAVSASISGFSGTMDASHIQLYRVVGLNSATPVATDTGTSNCTMDTSGALVAILAGGSDFDSVGSLTGGGNPTTSDNGARRCLAYDDAPTGASTSYDASSAQVWAGACWA